MKKIPYKSIPHKITQSDLNRRGAVHHLLDAWENSRKEGSTDDQIITAFLFIVLAETVNIYGESSTAKFASTLPLRLLQGEFSLNRVLH